MIILKKITIFLGELKKFMLLLHIYYLLYVHITYMYKPSVVELTSFVRSF